MRLLSHRCFPATPAAPREARRFVVEALQGLDVDREALQLATSELTTNAVIHARSEAEVSLFEGDGYLRIEVGDGSVEPPVVRDVPVSSPDGRGMVLVQKLSERSGSVATEGGKIVWFELPIRVAADFTRDPGAAHPLYSIGAVAQLVNVDLSTLRTWERRYGVVVPVRTEGGQRVYTRGQVEQLRFIAAHTAAGMSAGDAHRLLAAHDGSTTLPAETGISPLVLLAGRDPYAADLVEYFLRTEGYQVHIALDVDEARRSHAEQPAKLVILEGLLGPGSSLSLCRELAGAGVPVLVVSAVSMRDQAIDAGARAFIGKPFEPMTLVSVVRDLLGTSALSRRQVSVDEPVAYH